LPPPMGTIERLWWRGGIGITSSSGSSRTVGTRRVVRNFETSSRGRPVGQLDGTDPTATGVGRPSDDAVGEVVFDCRPPSMAGRIVSGIARVSLKMDVSGALMFMLGTPISRGHEAVSPMHEACDGILLYSLKRLVNRLQRNTR